jgi:hypothetical protein
MVALGFMEILILLVIALFLIGVPMVIIGLVIYISKRERNASSHVNSHVMKESGVVAENREGSTT